MSYLRGTLCSYSLPLLKSHSYTTWLLAFPYQKREGLHPIHYATSRFRLHNLVHFKCSPTLTFTMLTSRNRDSISIFLIPCLSTLSVFDSGWNCLACGPKSSKFVSMTKSLTLRHLDYTLCKTGRVDREYDGAQGVSPRGRGAAAQDPRSLKVLQPQT